LNKLIFTPKIIIAAPDNVAVCPPRGFGDTPSIRGAAQAHYLYSAFYSSSLSFSIYESSS